MRKLFLIVGVFLLSLFATPAMAQMQIGQCVDQVRGQAFAIYDNNFIVQIGNPGNQGIAMRDPSGLNFLRLPAANPMFQSFFVDWQGRLIEVNPNGWGPIGGCQFNLSWIPQNPFNNIYQAPAMSNWGVRTNLGIQALPTTFAGNQQRYVRPLITSPDRANACLQQSGGETNAFGDCMLRQMMGQREIAIYDCSRSASSKEQLALCIVGATGGTNERRIAGQLGQCFDTYGTNWNQYSLCMAEQNMDNDSARLLNCVREQSQNGDINVFGTAICYGAGRLNMNAEAQIAVQCAMTTGGEPIAFAGCAGGQLTARELNKCLTNGVGSHDCFGPNNEIVKGLNAVGIDIRNAFGPNNTIVQTWNNAVNDLQNGPGPNNDLVKAANTIANDLTNGPGKGNDIVKAIDNIIPGFSGFF
jgi:hypothetical protein